jgi:hypothetical protein
MRTTADKVRILAEINRHKVRKQGAEPDRLESVGDKTDTATAPKKHTSIEPLGYADDAELEAWYHTSRPKINVNKI